ncbi:MAG: hypothetical protein CME06_03645 [Gemmatimonadetes bacterium]|nr:hypothetical protein [Gemmatimonadota bacterium]
MFNRIPNGVHISPGVIGANDGVSNRMHEVLIPLPVETQSICTTIGQSASPEILEVALLLLRVRNSPIDQICGTSGRQDDKLFLREP